MSEKNVYIFAKEQCEGNATMKNLLGGKGANLAEMANIGITVPPGFTITTEMCLAYLKDNSFPSFLRKEVDDAIRRLETLTGKRFGDAKNPLLLSVRSGARVSMPGMMETVLNLGLNDETVAGLAAISGDERFAYDSYRRFIQMFGDVVRGVDIGKFEHILEEVRSKKGCKTDQDLRVGDLKEIVSRYKEVYQAELHEAFPKDPKIQLWAAIEAVFRSWNIPRAKAYREIHHIPAEWGTAVNVQTMVFGNLGNDSATGVAFTRNPATGEGKIFGEYLVNAQGEDVVAGIRTPMPVTEMKEKFPVCYSEFEAICEKLEKHYRDMQDMEFTIERGKLWTLQTRGGKRTAKAALRIAVEMVREGLITSKEALLRVKDSDLDQLLHPQLEKSSKDKAIAKGLAASPGAGVGKVVFDAETAVEWAKKGEKVVLVRPETSPEDIMGMNVAQGILTATGGMTSHAAVVARGMGRCCVAGCSELHIDLKKRQLVVNKVTFKEGDMITLDGSEGTVYPGAIKTKPAEMDDTFKTFSGWIDEYKKLGVRANADTPKDARVARGFGAEGIGLCRTEHMFFEEDRIQHMREMIFAKTVEEREKALAKLLPYQKEDFKGIFEAMAGLPVTIRYLDPPLHEFLPQTPKDREIFSKKSGIPLTEVEERSHQLHEMNPMLGHRGCRLAITYPEIYDMQTRAVFDAAIELKKEKSIDSIVEIMIPVVLDPRELSFLRERIEKIAREKQESAAMTLNYKIGTMIEIPRAAILAGEIARYADFFSFGTNDLTQTTCGLSRDDAGNFLKQYIEKGILDFDPFAHVDQQGVGELVRLGTARGRATKQNLKVGVCGEHGGDPKSVAFFKSAGLNYVSCSPYRIPAARLAAAKCELEGQNQ